MSIISPMTASRMTASTLSSSIMPASPVAFASMSVRRVTFTSMSRAALLAARSMYFRRGFIGRRFTARRIRRTGFRGRCIPSFRRLR